MNKKRVIKIAQSGIKDKEAKKIFEEFVNYMYDDFKEIIEAVVKARMMIKLIYGIETNEKIWDDIIQSVIARDMRLEREKKDK